MERMIAVCGLDCGTCEARLATEANDEEAKQRVAAKWRVEYSNPSVDVAYVTCDGCLSVEGHLGGHCYECDIRACGVARGLPNCAHCEDYDSCEKLARFVTVAPFVRATLDEIRARRP
jgi:hypothetical protein